MAPLGCPRDFIYCFAACIEDCYAPTDGSRYCVVNWHFSVLN